MGKFDFQKIIFCLKLPDSQSKLKIYRSRILPPVRTLLGPEIWALSAPNSGEPYLKTGAFRDLVLNGVLVDIVDYLLPKYELKTRKNDDKTFARKLAHILEFGPP